MSRNPDECVNVGKGTKKVVWSSDLNRRNVSQSNKRKSLWQHESRNAVLINSNKKYLVILK